MIRTPQGLAPLQSRARRLLAVFPHPDDEAYGPAGALARTARADDAAAALLCLTRGEAARFGADRGLAPDALGALRERRLEEVASILGLDGLIVGGFPDSRLARCDLEELAAAIRAVLDAFRPQVVIGHDPRGVNAHPDHIATHWALRRALGAFPGTRFAMTAYPPAVAAQAKPRLLFPTPEAEIDAVLHLSPEESEAKERCLRVHEAFVTLDPGHPDPDLVRRPPIERYDFLGEDCAPPVDDLFAGLTGTSRGGATPA